jgi:hypothetical protein
MAARLPLADCSVGVSMRGGRSPTLGIGLERETLKPMSDLFSCCPRLLSTRAATGPVDLSGISAL